MGAVEQAVIYGLPLVMMDLTMRRMTNVPHPSGIDAPVNRFAHAPVVPDASFKNVVRANVDTLYSSAFLDLSSEPMVLSVPDTDGRYYLLPVIDAWTNVIATPGARTTGTKAGDFVITGPGWAGSIPAGMRELRSSTDKAWILGRTQTNGPDDYQAVHAVQAGYRIAPLSKFGSAYVQEEGDVDPDADMKTPPVVALQRMGGLDFFDRLATLLSANPPPAEDAPMLAILATLGVVPGRPFNLSAVDPAARGELEGAVSAAIKGLQSQSRQFGALVNGWRIPNMNVGAFGTDYATRAFIALIALGANLPADSLYPTSFAREDGEPLDGGNRYVLRFERGLTPPVKAFWSVTMYDPDSFFVDNAINRYAISSWMPLRHSDDGSLELYIQHASPGADRAQNWLPAPLGHFNVTMRMYWPEDRSPSILDGSWMPPKLMKA